MTLDYLFPYIMKWRFELATPDGKAIFSDEWPAFICQHASYGQEVLAELHLTLRSLCVEGPRLQTGVYKAACLDIRQHNIGID